MEANVLNQLKIIALDEIKNHIDKHSPTELVINIIEKIKKYLRENKFKPTDKEISSMIVYFNLLLDENNININIRESDYKDTERLIARNQIYKYIDKLKEQIKNKEYAIDENELQDIKYLMRHYDFLEESIEIYYSLSKIYNVQKDFNMEYDYLTKAYGLMNRISVSNINYEIIIALIKNYISKERYEDANILYQRTVLYAEYIQKQVLLKLYYFGAVSYMRLKEYEMSLELCFDILDNIKNQDYNTWYRTYLLKGVCYHKLTDYESAIIEYNKALQVFSFIGYGENKYTAYYNIILAYLKLEEYKEAEDYLEVLIKGLKEFEVHEEEYADLANKIAMIYEVLGKFEEAKLYYMISLEATSYINKETLLIENINRLLEIDKNQEIQGKETIFDIIENYIDKITDGAKANTDLFLKILDRYNKKKQYDRLDVLINKILKIT